MATILLLAAAHVALGVAAAGGAGAASHHPILAKESRPILYSIPAGDQFGNKIAALADLTGDGVPDFAAGIQTLTPLYGEAALRSGPTGAKVRDVVAPTETLYPTRIADAGDVDRDGVRDIAVGSEGATFDSRRGAVRVYSGRDGHLLWTATGSVNEQLGAWVTGVGDVDGDGAADVAAGARKFNGGVGRVQLYSGASGALIRTFSAPAGARDFGASVARLRDADGDRLDDLLIGAPAVDQNAAHSVYVYSMATGALISSASGAAPTQAFGSRAGDAGDFDGDGRGDYWVGDSSFGGTLQNGGPGRFQVYSGATGALLFQVDGSNAGEELGHGGASADFNGDGYSDVMVSAFDGAANSVGRVRIHAGPTGQVLKTIPGEIPNERFGNSTEVLGDVDGNGTLDFLATTFGADEPRTYAIDSGLGPGHALVTPGAVHSGIWYQASHSGEGFVLEMLGDARAVVYYFTYTAGGAQRYFVAAGDVVGNRVVFNDLVSTAGGRLGGAFDPAGVARLHQSRLVLAFDGCDSGWAEYTIDGVGNQQRLTRLTGIPGIACAGGAEIARRDWSGTWYDPSHSGEGWIVQAADPTHYVVIWFTYNDDGTQQWMIGFATVGGQRIEDAGIVRPVGGRFGRYFRAAEVTRPAWGRLTLDFDGCSGAHASWDGTGGAGTSPLVRLTSLQGLHCE